MRGNVNFFARVSDPIGLADVDFIVNDNLVYPQTNLESPSQTIDTAATLHIDGRYNYMVRAENNVGYQIEETVQFTIDNTAPTFNWTLPNNTYFSGDYVFDVTANDNIGIASAILRVDGVQVANFGADGSQTSIQATYTISMLSYIEGSHTVTFELIDNAGAITTQTKTIFFDRSPPTVTIQNINNSVILSDAPYALNFVVGDTLGISNGDVTISIDGVDVGSVNANDTVFYIDPNTLQEGDRVVMVTAVDRSGKTNQKSVIFNFQHKPIVIELPMAVSWGTPDNWDSVIIYNARIHNAAQGEITDINVYYTHDNRLINDWVRLRLLSNENLHGSYTTCDDLNQNTDVRIEIQDIYGRVFNFYNNDMARYGRDCDD